MNEYNTKKQLLDACELIKAYEILCTNLGNYILEIHKSLSNSLVPNQIIEILNIIKNNSIKKET